MFLLNLFIIFFTFYVHGMDIIVKQNHAIDIFEKLINQTKSMAAIAFNNTKYLEDMNFIQGQDPCYHKAYKVFQEAKDFFSNESNFNKFLNKYLIELSSEENVLLKNLVHHLFWLTDCFDTQIKDIFPSKDFLTLFLNQNSENIPVFSETVQIWLFYYLQSANNNLLLIASYEEELTKSIKLLNQSPLFKINIRYNGMLNFCERHQKLYWTLNNKIEALEEYMNSKIWVDKCNYTYKPSVKNEAYIKLTQDLSALKKMLANYSNENQSIKTLHDNIKNLQPTIITFVESFFEQFIKMPFFKDYSIEKKSQDSSYEQWYDTFLKEFKNDIFKRIIIFCQPYINEGLLKKDVLEESIIHKYLPENNTDIHRIVDYFSNNNNLIISALYNLFTEDVLNPITKDIGFHAKEKDACINKLTLITKYSNSFQSPPIWCEEWFEKTIFFPPNVKLILDFQYYLEYKDIVEKYIMIIKWIEENKILIKKNLFLDCDEKYKPSRCRAEEKAKNLLYQLFMCLEKSPLIKVLKTTYFFQIKNTFFKSFYYNQNAFKKFSSAEIKNKILLPLKYIIKYLVLSNKPLLLQKIPFTVFKANYAALKKYTLQHLPKQKIPFMVFKANYHALKKYKLKYLPSSL